jgi:putative endonuclease
MVSVCQGRNEKDMEPPGIFQWLTRLRGWFRRPDAGAQGEALAAEFLRREHGFALVARNWRSPHDRRDEIDLVCRDGEVLVFVEVKARTAGALVPGYYAVDRRKKRVLRRVCTAYLRHLRPIPRTFRLDIVEVEMPTAAAGGEPVIRHFANIPLFPKDFHPGP